MSGISSDVSTFDTAMRSAGRFVYDNITSIVVVSVLWALASIPLVTVGVASLAAYAMILSLRQPGSVDWAVVRERVAENWRHATLLAPLPVLFGLVSVLYILGAVGDVSAVQRAIAAVSFYVAIYLVLVLIPTFVLLATGADVWTALVEARSWVGDHPTLALGTAFVTGVLFVATGALTIAFPLLFGGLACSVHVAVVLESDLYELTDEDVNEGR